MDNYTDVMFCLQVAHAAAKLREEAEMSQMAKERADAEAKKLEAAAALEREIERRRPSVRRGVSPRLARRRLFF